MLLLGKLLMAYGFGNMVKHSLLVDVWKRISLCGPQLNLAAGAPSEPAFLLMLRDLARFAWSDSGDDRCSSMRPEQKTQTPTASQDSLAPEYYRSQSLPDS